MGDGTERTFAWSLVPPLPYVIVESPVLKVRSKHYHITGFTPPQQRKVYWSGNGQDPKTFDVEPFWAYHYDFGTTRRKTMITGGFMRDMDARERIANVEGVNSRLVERVDALEKRLTKQTEAFDALFDLLAKELGFEAATEQPLELSVFYYPSSPRCLAWTSTNGNTPSIAILRSKPQPGGLKPGKPRSTKRRK